ncbi:MAG: hypothetical protein ABL861_03715 [Nitrosomonas sp.]
MNRIEAQGFWQWAFSDFMSNALRGVLAEYIVASAIGCTHKPRTEWDAYDLMTEDGLKIEVKSSAYLQTWQQKKHSTIRFDIGHKQAWDAQNNTSSSQAVRSANVYVFCVFAAMDKSTADPLDLTQWFFIVCPTATLTEKLGNQKSVGLASLEQHGLERFSFSQLAAAINAVKANIALNKLGPSC